MSDIKDTQPNDVIDWGLFIFHCIQGLLSLEYVNKHHKDKNVRSTGYCKYISNPLNLKSSKGREMFYYREMYRILNNKLYINIKLTAVVIRFFFFYYTPFYNTQVAYPEDYVISE